MICFIVQFYFRRSCQRICLPRCRRNRQRWIILKTRSPRRLQKILHLPWRCCPRVRMPNRNCLQNRRFWWFRQLRRPRRCSRMVSFYCVAYPNPNHTNKFHQTVINQTLRIARIHRCLIAFITSSFHFHTSNHWTQHSQPPTEYHINIFSI